MNGASHNMFRYQAASPTEGKRAQQRKVATIAGLALTALLGLGLVSHLLPSSPSNSACPRHALFPGEYGRQALRNLTAFRSDILQRLVPEFGRKELPDKDLRYSRYDRFPPAVTCPPGRDLVRYGNAGEGGKLLCDLAALQAPCVIYSMGSKGDYSFERSVLRATPCAVHTFDCTFDGKSIHERHRYHKVCIGAEPNRTDFMMYADLTSWLGHNKVDLLKIDIEGHEFRVMGAWKEGQPGLPAQIVAELHFHTVEEEHMLANTVAKALPHMGLLFMHLANLGYAPVEREDNMNANLGCCSEYTFLKLQN